MRCIHERVIINMNIESNCKVKTGLTPWLRVCCAEVGERLCSCHCLCHVVCAPGRITGFDEGTTGKHEQNIMRDKHD
jgi:hypothetical protein